LNDKRGYMGVAVSQHISLTHTPLAKLSRSGYSSFPMNRPTPIIDTHCHLYYDDFKPDWDEMLRRAEEAGVSGMIAVGADAPSSRQAVEIAKSYPHIYCTVGIHPHDAQGVDEATIIPWRNWPATPQNAWPSARSVWISSATAPPATNRNGSSGAFCRLRANWTSRW